MTTINFIRISEETDKAVKVVVREAGYDLEKFKAVFEKSFWIPKSISSVDGNTISVADWFYDKHIAVDAYGAFMKKLSNS